MRRAAEAEVAEAEGGKPTQRSSRPATGTSRPFSAGGRKTFLLDNLPPPAGDFVLASYVIDFGNVINVNYDASLVIKARAPRPRLLGRAPSVVAARRAQR